MNKKNFKNKFIKLFYKEKIMKNKLFNYKKIAEIWLLIMIKILKKYNVLIILITFYKNICLYKII